MFPLTFWQPLIYATFLWWFLTGLIFAFYNRRKSIKLLGFIVLTLAMLAALWVVQLNRDSTQPIAVYLSLTAGIVIWGWQTASYYLGFLTGPSNEKQPISRPETFIERTKLAIRSSLYHELTVLGFAILLAGLTWSQPNRWALWIYLAVWIMHSLAKINIFLGVRNFYIDFMPDHMQHLAELLPKRKSNPLLLPTIAVALSFSLMLFYLGIIPQTSAGDAVGYLFVGTNIALGTLEIMMLVLPIPATLWGWRLRLFPDQPKEV